MNINGLNANSLIDATSAAKVSEQLFSALSKKSVDYSKVDLSKFNRPTVGVDLYNGKTDINVQRQVAIANSGAFQHMNLNSVQALNAFAAQNLYASNVSEKVGGKMTINSNDVDFEFVSHIDEATSAMNVFESNKDKKDSNPFSFDGFNSSKSNEQA